MVSHDGGDFLPRTLAALAAQTRQPDTCIGVDTGSRDDSAALLEQAFGTANVTDFQQTRSGMGGRSAPRGPEKGADTPVWLATLPEGDETTGGLFADRRPLPW